MANWKYYKNGNYTVGIDLDNGTKVRFNDKDTLDADMPESADVNLTDWCDGGCPYCYRNCTEQGKHADILNEKIFDSMHPWMEIALGGGNVLAHPDLDEFLVRCRDKNLIPSITVNQMHFEKEIDRLRKYRDDKLIYGVGVSIINPTDNLIREIREFPNAVVHLIAGITPLSTFEKLANNGLKVLILGYKDVGRGESFFNHNANTVDAKLEWLRNFIPNLIKSKWFEVVSFDNLALKQLDVKNHVHPRWWKEHYMGDDGVDGELTSASMYIDLVAQTYARNSFSDNVRKIKEHNINKMFEDLRRSDGN